MSKILLQVQGGQKKFLLQTILDSINLTIQSGEFVAIVGPSGSGKTTLLRLLAGLDVWSQGNTESAPNTRSGFVFQEPNLLSWRTVLENTTLPLELHGQISRAEKGLHALKQVHLSPAAQLFPHELSGGMKMRTSIARALVTDPDILFMDEPFAALDEPTRDELQEQLHSLWQNHSATVVFVTHSIQEAIFLSNRILLLGNQPATILKDYTLRLPKERNFTTRTSDLFFEEVKILRNLLHESNTVRAPE